MSRHQIPQHKRRRLTIAAIAATALIGGTVTAGIMGIASAGEDGGGALTAAECQAQQPPADDGGDQQQPPADQNGGDQNGGDQQGGDQQQPPADGDQNGGDQQQPPADGDQNGGDQQQPPADQNGGDQQQPPADQNGGDQQQPPADDGGDQQQPPAQTYGVTAPQAAHPDNPVDGQNDTNIDPNAGDQQPPADNGGDQQPPADNGGDQQPPADNGGDQQQPPADGGDQNGGDQQQPPADGGDQNGGDQVDPNCVGPFAEDFVDINDVQPGAVVQPQAGDNASTGSVTKSCGVNDGFINSDNFIAAPGVVNGAEHQHHQVGNLNSNANSNEQNLPGAGTSCPDGDESTYFWPIIRLRSADAAQDQALDQVNPHNIGQPIEAASAEIKFKGNEQSPVVPMPQFLRVITGDAKAANENLGKGNDNAKWTCSGQEDRIATDKYVLCPDGSQTERISNFPSCWDGQNIDSADHRSHIKFKDEQTGACPDGFQAVPELQITLKYDIPQGQSFAVDSFPKDLHNPITDHNDFVNVMTPEQMQKVVDTINSGQQG